MFIFLLGFLVSAQVSSEFSPKTEKEQNSTLSEIVVTSELEKNSHPSIRVIGAKSQKDREQIKQNQSRSLGDVLKYEPGLEFVSSGRAGTEAPQIRGLGTQRILVLEEGVRQNFQGAHAGRGLSDFSLMENVEVVKGAWSSLYGSGAMGGVFNFRRSTAEDLKRRTGRQSATEFAADAASGSDLFGGRVTWFSAQENFKPLISYRKSKNNEMRFGNGERLPYSAAQTEDVYSSLSYQFSQKHKVDLKFNRYTQASDTLLNAGQDLSATNTAATMISVKEDLVLDYSLSQEKSNYRLKPFYRKTKINKVRSSDQRTDSQIVETTGIDTWTNQTLSLSEQTQVVTTFGIEFFQDRNQGSRNGGSLSSFPNGSSEVYGVYVQPSVILNQNLTLSPGLRFDSYKNTDSSGALKNSEGSQSSAKMYVSYEYLPQNTVFVGWGQSYNAPRLQDIYVSGLHFPGNFFISNPDLKPEKANSYEIGAKLESSLENDRRLKTQITLFQTDATDFVQQVVGATTTTFTNVSSVQLRGYELSSFYLAPSWLAGLSYTQVISRNNTTGEPLADTSPDALTLHGEFLLGDSYKFGTDLKWSAKQSRVPAVTSNTPEYFTQDLYFTWLGEQSELQVRLNNLADRYYRKHGSQIYEQGRDLRLNASFFY